MDGTSPQPHRGFRARQHVLEGLLFAVVLLSAGGVAGSISALFSPFSPGQTLLRIPAALASVLACAALVLIVVQRGIKLREAP